MTPSQATAKHVADQVKKALLECSQALPPELCIELANYIAAIGLEASMQMCQKYATVMAKGDGNVYATIMATNDMRIENGLTWAAQRVIPDIFVAIDFKSRPSMLPPEPPRALPPPPFKLPNGKTKLYLVKNDVAKPDERA